VTVCVFCLLSVAFVGRSTRHQGTVGDTDVWAKCCDVGSRLTNHDRSSLRGHCSRATQMTRPSSSAIKHPTCHKTRATNCPRHSDTTGRVQYSLKAIDNCRLRPRRSTIHNLFMCDRSRPNYWLTMTSVECIRKRLLVRSGAAFQKCIWNSPLNNPHRPLRESMTSSTKPEVDLHRIVGRRGSISRSPVGL